MKKIIAILVVIGLFAASWNAKKCEHLFTAIEQAEVKLSTGITISSSMFVSHSGKHEGRELVCVKCFHVQKQVLDYGSAESKLPNMPNIPGGTVIAPDNK
jgi:hypothetical protein